MRYGGQISLTTDTWSSSSSLEFAAVTAHWIDSEFMQFGQLLGLIHLDKVHHTGEYLAQVLLQITEAFHCTKAVFTITRDNASSNDVMVKVFESRSRSSSINIPAQYPSNFSHVNGNVRCFAHIINLAAQEMIKQLKVEPGDEDIYAYEEGKAEVIPSSKGKVSTLLKVWKLIYTFRNRRQLRDQLQRHCELHLITYRRLKIDMPVRWNSTAAMLSSFLHLRVPIIAVLATQTLDRSLRNFMLDDNEWEIIKNLLSCFNIFVKISTHMQSESTPTLNWTVPLYLQMVRRLGKQETLYGTDSPIGKACMLAQMKLLDYFDIMKGCYHSKFAMVLDPRFNLATYRELLLNQDQVNELKHLFISEFNRYSRAETERQELAKLSSDSYSDDKSSNDATDDEYDIFKPRKRRFTTPEYTRYFNLEREDRAIQPLQWWRTNALKFPVLAVMACNYLAIPATSAASERVFSTAGNIVTKNRNRLAPSSIEQLISLNRWGIAEVIDDSINSDSDEASD